LGDYPRETAVAPPATQGTALPELWLLAAWTAGAALPGVWAAVRPQDRREKIEGWIAQAIRSSSNGGREGRASCAWTYTQASTYSDRNELVGATRGGGLLYGWTRGYEYGPIGNRQSQDMDAVRTTYTSNELN
jgi:hypothetical protein